MSVAAIDIVRLNKRDRVEISLCEIFRSYSRVFHLFYLGDSRKFNYTDTIILSVQKSLNLRFFYRTSSVLRIERTIEFSSPISYTFACELIKRDGTVVSTGDRRDIFDLINKTHRAAYAIIKQSTTSHCTIQVYRICNIFLRDRRVISKLTSYVLRAPCVHNRAAASDDVVAFNVRRSLSPDIIYHSLFVHLSLSSRAVDTADSVWRFENVCVTVSFGSAYFRFRINRARPLGD